VIPAFIGLIVAAHSRLVPAGPTETVNEAKRILNDLIEENNRVANALAKVSNVNNARAIETELTDAMTDREQIASRFQAFLVAHQYDRATKADEESMKVYEDRLKQQVGILSKHANRISGLRDYSEIRRAAPGVADAVDALR